MAEQWLSYQQIGEVLGISSAAARHKVSRYRFARRLRGSIYNFGAAHRREATAASSNQINSCSFLKHFNCIGAGTP
jgi:hypothetical protein